MGATDTAYGTSADAPSIRGGRCIRSTWPASSPRCSRRDGRSPSRPPSRRSGSHTVDGEPFYDVHVEGFDYPGLVEASRVEAAAPLDE